MRAKKRRRICADFSIPETIARMAGSYMEETRGSRVLRKPWLQWGDGTIRLSSRRTALVRIQL